MILNTTPVTNQRDYIQSLSSAASAGAQYSGDTQYQCQSYSEDPYLYPSHFFGTTADVCDTWTNHRFFVNGDTTTAPLPDSLSPADPVSGHCGGGAAGGDSGQYYSHECEHHHHRHYNHHQQHEHQAVHQHTHHHHHQPQQQLHFHGYNGLTTQADLQIHQGACASLESACSAGEGQELGLLVTMGEADRQAGKRDLHGQAAFINDAARAGATERERTRMHMLNDAFDELRKVGSLSFFIALRLYIDNFFFL